MRDGAHGVAKAFSCTQVKYQLESNGNSIGIQLASPVSGMPPPPVAPKPSGVNPSRNVSKTIRREGRGERERERVGEKSGRIVSAVSQSVENRRSLRNKLGLRRREKREERREKREERREKREVTATEKYRREKRGMHCHYLQLVSAIPLYLLSLTRALSLAPL